MNKENLKQKIAVVGAGAVGSTTAYTLMVKNLASEVVLIDINKDKEEGEVRDMCDALSFSETSKVIAGTYDDLKNMDIIVITAGIAQKPGESRLDLVTKNKAIISSIFKEVNGLNSSTIIIVVSNPVDVLTYLVQEISGLPKSQVIGTGTTLDSARLRSNISNRLNIDSKQVEGYVFGEHGDTEFVAWSTVSVGGKPIKEMFSIEEMEKIENEVKNEVYEIIKKKGATYYGIAMTVSDIVEALIYDQNKILPVSSRLDSWNGVSGICLGSTAVIGARGVIKTWPVELPEDEKKKFNDSAEKIKQYL